jgi:hypothetical protein
MTGAGYVLWLIMEAWLAFAVMVCEPILVFLVVLSIGVWRRNDFTPFAPAKER